MTQPNGRFMLVWLSSMLLVACVTPPTFLSIDRLPDLPVAISNNAVAVIHDESGPTLFTFLGLETGKTYRDVSSRAYMLAPGAPDWQALTAPPGPGRLAATAVAVGAAVYLFGGYTVAADGSEKSIDTVHRFDPVSQRYRKVAPMPVPVDDALSVVYQERYIYLISGWHDTGNVNLVQGYDTHTNEWFQATPYPGVPVFGHAGGLVSNQLVVCGGVRIQSTALKRRFVAERACYRGQVDASNVRKIDWMTLAHPPGPALYRAAGVGAYGAVWLAGGSDNPYNYNGMGYNGVPSTPQPNVWRLDLESLNWALHGTLSAMSMDHRGLVDLGDGHLAVIGGMHKLQQVSPEVFAFPVTPP